MAVTFLGPTSSKYGLPTVGVSVSINFTFGKFDVTPTRLPPFAEEKKPLLVNYSLENIFVSTGYRKKNITLKICKPSSPVLLYSVYYDAVRKQIFIMKYFYRNAINCERLLLKIRNLRLKMCIYIFYCLQLQQMFYEINRFFNFFC